MSCKQPWHVDTDRNRSFLVKIKIHCITLEPLKKPHEFLNLSASTPIFKSSGDYHISSSQSIWPYPKSSWQILRTATLLRSLLLFLSSITKRSGDATTTTTQAWQRLRRRVGRVCWLPRSIGSIRDWMIRGLFFKKTIL